jgi:hypothetical protein
MTSAIAVVEAQARFGNVPVRPVYVRVAADGDRIFLDLGNDDWNAVEVTRAGWQLVAEQPVRFQRARGMEPVPQRGGTVDALREHINVDVDDFILLVAFLLMAMRGRGPYPILLFTGEQGSAKARPRGSRADSSTPARLICGRCRGTSTS